MQNNTNCRIINIVWIERGILFAIFAYILKNYDTLIDKIIIIDNKNYRKFFSIIFSKLKFKKYKYDSDNNFYFNIRRIIKKQDVIIDYISNYKKYINTKKIKLIPWYDLNDPLIIYKYNENNKLKIKKYTIFFKIFSSCRRANYNGTIWDSYIENKIMLSYIKKNPNIKFNFLLNFINTFIRSNYTNTTNNIIQIKEYPKIYYQQVEKPAQQIVVEKQVVEKQVVEKQVDEKQVEQHVEKHVEKIVEKSVEKTIEKIIERIIEKQTTKIIEKPGEKDYSSVEINNENNMNELINLLNNKISLINNLI